MSILTVLIGISINTLIGKGEGVGGRVRRARLDELRSGNCPGVLLVAG